MTLQHDRPLKARRMRVSYIYRDSRKSETSSPSRPNPYLRLQGRWLKEAGFTIGRSVRVEVAQGRLTIEAVD